MPTVKTRFLGQLDYEEDSLFRFPSGIPGFEEHTSFVFLNQPGLEPLLFLQSLTSGDLCFILLPILVIDQQYRLQLAPEEMAEIGLPPGTEAVIGGNILCAAVVCAGEGDGPTANMMAPIVVNLQNKTGIQIIRADSGYSHKHAVRIEKELAPC